MIKAAAGLASVWVVGAIFISAVDTNPALLLGFGTWLEFGKGRVLVGVDELDPDFNTVLETGGEKTHLLTVGEIPSHQHGYTAPNAPANSRLVGLLSSVDGVTPGALTDATGGGGAHNNVQPYITVRMWRRVA